MTDGGGWKGAWEGEALGKPWGSVARSLEL
jgi:hypothetical protein